MLDVVDASLTTVSALMDFAEVLVGWSTGFSMAWTFSSGFESGPFATGSAAKQVERNATRRKETFILLADWNLSRSVIKLFKLGEKLMKKFIKKQWKY